MVFLVAISGVFILGLIVFGGGQVFMPLFKSLWKILENMGVEINDQKVQDIFTIANSTPGVVSTKFALFTGYLIANGEWWGWLALILTYSVFVIPSVIMIIFAFKFVHNSESSKYLSIMTKYLRPVIAGIVLALAIQLFIGTAFPNIIFNDGVMFGIKSTSVLTGYRMWVIIPYCIIVICETIYFYHYKQVNLFWLILIHLVLGLIIFQPWLLA